MAGDSASQGEGWVGREGGVGKVPGLEPWPRGGGDHRRVVGRKRECREGYAEASAGGFGAEALAEFAIGGDTSGYKDAADAQ